MHLDTVCHRLVERTVLEKEGIEVRAELVIEYRSMLRLNSAVTPAESL